VRELKVGDKVKCNYDGGLRWYEGTIQSFDHGTEPVFFSKEGANADRGWARDGSPGFWHLSKCQEHEQWEFIEEAAEDPKEVALKYIDSCLKGPPDRNACCPDDSTCEGCPLSMDGDNECKIDMMGEAIRHLILLGYQSSAETLSGLFREDIKSTSWKKKDDKALEASIAHWQDNIDKATKIRENIEKISIQSSSCALCSTYKECRICPLGKVDNCPSEDSAWSHCRNALNELRSAVQSFKTAANAMQEKLESLR